VLPRAIKDANGEVTECPKQMRSLYQEDSLEFFAKGNHEYWADPAGTSIPNAALEKLTA